MSDVIRLARHANHYLAIFDKGKAAGAVSHEASGLAWPSESCCTPRTVGVRLPAAACPAITAKSIMSPTAPSAAAPTSTT